MNNKKRKQRKIYKINKQQEIKTCSLLKYNALKYIQDYEIIGKLSYVSKSRLEWIIDTRYKLQFSANKYEKEFGKFLIDNKIDFIHQMPFIISGIIYFLDFYIPDKRIAFEIDGESHSSMVKHDNDNYRDYQFNSINIKTYRIPNSEIGKNNILGPHIKSILGTNR